MKIPNMEGEFGFKALVSFPKSHPEEWHLSNEYFFSEVDAIKAADGATVKWPVEVLDNGSVYIPDRSELE